MILPEPTPQFVAHRPPRSPSPRAGVRRRQSATSPCPLDPVRGSRHGSRRSWTSAASTASVEADDDDDSCSDCSVASVTGARGRGVVLELAAAVEDAFRNPWHWSVAPVPVRPRLPPPTPPRPSPIRRFRTVQDGAWVDPVAPPWWWPPSPRTYRASVSDHFCSVRQRIFKHVVPHAGEYTSGRRIYTNFGGRRARKVSTGHLQEAGAGSGRGCPFSSRWRVDAVWVDPLR